MKEVDDEIDGMIDEEKERQEEVKAAIVDNGGVDTGNPEADLMRTDKLAGVDGEDDE
jgi:hypothetical protein